jgi:hypothetical protein
MTTFKKITNDDIYSKLLSIEDQVRMTNGSVKLHRKWLYGVSTLFLALLGFAFNLALRN